MQLDLLYSFFYCLHGQTQEDSGYKYTDICVFLYSMKERAVTGITWLPGVEGQRAGLHCLSKASTQSLSPPLPRVTLSNNKKRNKNQRIKRGKQVNWN